jgi:hypothetical protein
VILLFSVAEDDHSLRQCRWRADESSFTKPDERLDEIAALLAAGLMRLRARKSSPLSRHDGESSLDFSADQRGHASTKGRQEHA